MGVAETVYQGSNGTKIVTVIPGVYTIINTDATAGTSFASDRNVAYLGSCPAIKPNTLYQFADEKVARRICLSGQLYRGLFKGFTGAVDFKPSKLFAMNPQNNTQASVTLQSTTPNDQIKLYALNYGTPGNLTTVIVAAGTSEGKKIQLSHPDLEDEVFDNLIYKSFTLNTSNGAASATVSITSTGLTTQLDGAGTDLDINFEDAPTLEALVNLINTKSGYTAELLGDPEARCEYLDTVTDENIYDATTATLESTVQYIIDYLNQNATLIEKAEFVGTSREDIDNLTETEFVGGTSPVTSDSDWDDLFTELENHDIQIIVVTDTTQSIILKAQEFAKKMWKQEYKRNTLVFCGSSETDTISDKKDLSRLLNSEFMYLFGHNVNDFDEYGREEAQDGRDLACKAGGIAADTDVNVPLTYKKISGLSLAEDLSPALQAEYIKAGVIMLKYSDVDGGMMFLRSISTYQSDNLSLNEYSMVRNIAWQARDRFLNLQRHLEKPDKNIKTLPADLKSKDRKRLADYKQLGYIAVDPSGQKQSIAFHTITQDADKFIIKSKVLIPAPDNFVFVDMEFDTV